MPISYRPARDDDLERAGEIVVRSMNDLSERHGFGPMGSARPPSFSRFSLADDPDGLWVAEEDGKLQAFGWSWACGDLWFLAQLFVSPDCQSRGIGQDLLRRTLAHADRTKASCRALITFTFNRVSQALYIRHGFLPRLPLYILSGEPRAAAGERLLRAEPMTAADADSATLAGIDTRVLGVSRAKHHRFLRGDGTTRGHLLFAGGDCVGYAYVTADGQIGPLAVTERGALVPAFATAIDLAARRGAAQVSAFVPGTSVALAAALARGLRIGFPMVLMATRDFGDWSLYLPRNPGFM